MQIRNKSRILMHSSLAKGFCITLLGSGASKAILMLATFLFTHLLSKEDFGSFSFIRNTLNIIFCISALNFVGLVTKFAAEVIYKKECASRIFLLFAFSLLVCMLIGVSLVFLPETTLYSITGINTLNVYFRLVGLLLPMFMLQPLIEGVFRGFKLFKLIGILQTTTSVIFVIFVCLGAYLCGLDGAVIGLIMYYFIYALISCCVCVKRLPLRKAFSSISWLSLKSQFGILWTMVLPVFVLSFIEAPINWWAQVLMTKYDSIGSIGSMSAILQIRNLLIIVPNYFFSTFTAFQATLNAQGNQKQYFSNLKKAFCGCIFIGLCSALVFSMLGAPILGLYGSEYTTDLFGFYIAMASFPFLITISLFRSSLLIKEHQRIMLFTSIASSFTLIGVMYLLLPNKVDPVESYFWGQLGYLIIMFIVFGIYTLKDSQVLKTN